MLTWPGADGPDQIIDDGGAATMLIHKGKDFEEKFAKEGCLPDPYSTTNPEFKCVPQTIKDSIGVDPKTWTKMAVVVKGVSEETYCILAKTMASHSVASVPGVFLQNHGAAVIPLWRWI